MPMMPFQNQYAALPQTPGSAVANTLQDIITAREIQKQQAEKDALERAKFSADTQYNTERLAGLAEQRQAVAEMRKATAADLAQKTADRTADQERMNAFMESPEFYQLPDNVQQQLGIAHTTGDKELFRTVLANMGKPNPADEMTPGYYLDEPTGTMKPMLDPTTKQPIKMKKGERPLTRSYPPNAPVDAGQVIDKPVIGPDGNPDPTKMLVNKRGTLVIQDVPQGYKIGGIGDVKHNPNATGDKGKYLNINSQDVQTLGKAIAKATAPGGMFGGSAKQQDVAAYYQVLAGILGKSSADPSVKMTVRQIQQNEPNTPINDIITRYQAQYGNDPTFGQFVDLLHIVRGQ